MGLLRRGTGSKGSFKILYATDIHGSEVTWRKFLNSAKFYKVDALVCGGDLMGKILVPVVRGAGGVRTARFQGRTERFAGGEELARFTKVLQTLGHYWYECDEDEYLTLRDDEPAIDALFTDLAKVRLRAWAELAEDRLAGTHVQAFLQGGNDDTDDVLSVLSEPGHDRVVAAEGRMVQVGDNHTMVSLGYSTPTPWNTPREASDEQLEKMIRELVADVDDPSRCIFNFHVPPLDSTLDTCLQLDESVWPPTPIVRGGQPVEFGAGSAAVRDALEEYQPLIGLHGHIHESRGSVRYGHTAALNPGSEYGEGVLRGAIVTVKDDQVAGTQFTSG